MRLIIFAVFILVGLNFQLLAQASSDSLKIIYLNNGVVVSAQREETNAFDRPESVGYLPAAGLQQAGPISMPDALARMPGVWMQKTNHGGGSAFIRGLTGYQTLLMVDGIRMNNSTYRSGPNQYLNTVDYHSVSRLEVLRGAGSVQYGSDAIGGTIQMFTLTPDFHDAGWKVSGKIFGKIMSASMEQSGRAQLSVASSRVAVSAGLTYSNFGDIVAGGSLGKLTPTGYDQMAMDFKGIFKVNERNMLTAVYRQMTQNDVPLYHKIVSGKYQRYHFNPQGYKMAYLRWESFYKSKIFSHIRYTVSWQQSEEVREKQKHEELTKVTEQDKVHTAGAMVEIVSDMSNRWHASSGIEYYHDFVNSTANIHFPKMFTENTRGLYPDGATYGNLALFSLHNYQVGKWEFTGGLRYNLVNMSLSDTLFGSTTLTPKALVGNAGVVYALSENHHLVASINSAFRAPNINDVSSFGIADFRYEVPAYDLQPETSVNKDIGYKWRLERSSGAVHLFHNKLNDLIANVPSKYNGMDSLDGYKVYKRENIKEAAIYGFEAESEMLISDNFVAFGNIAYTYGQNITDDEPMRRIPPLNGRLGVRSGLGHRFNGMAEMVFAGSQTRLSSGDIADERIAAGGTPEWSIVNIYAGYEHKLFDLNVGLQNIFDAAYRVHGSGIDGIGRSIWMSVNFKINS